MHALTAHPHVSPADRLGVTTFFAILGHLILILGVTFVPEDHPERRVERLDVVLVPPSAEAAPDRPDYLAPANRDGGGDGAGKTRLERPPAAGESSTAAAVDAMPPSTPPTGPAPGTLPDSALNQGTAMRASETAGDRTGAEAIPADEASFEAAPAEAARTDPAAVSAPAAARGDGAAESMNRSREIAALSATVERKLRAYTERPRRRWISARTREHAFAAYMDAWRRKVERIGNLNYPEEAARRGLSGHLLLEVALNPDGAIEDIALRRSSGQPVLDDAAVRIVQLAAPFARFPEGIAEEVDVLHIERTWIFHSGNRFTSP